MLHQVSNKVHKSSLDSFFTTLPLLIVMGSPSLLLCVDLVCGLSVNILMTELSGAWA